MKTNFLKSFKIIFSLMILYGMALQSFAQCSSCPSGSTLISTSNYQINSSGTYCVVGTVTNLTINAGSVNLNNQGTIHGTVNFWGGNSTFNNCGYMHLTGPLQVPNSSTLNNYNTLNSTSSVTNNGGALDAKPGSSMTISQLAINSGIMYIGGNVTTTFTGNYATTNAGNITGQGGTLTTSTFNHTGTLLGTLTLPNGRPTAGSGNIASTITFYSCSGINKYGAWTQRASFPGGQRSNPLVFSYNGRIYVGLGQNFPTLYTDLRVYNTVTNTWSTVSTTFPNSQSTQVIGQGRVIGTKVYFVTHNACTMNTWEYDIVNNIWTQKNDMPYGAGYGAFTFVENNKFYIGGGFTYCSSGKPMNGFAEFNPATGVWTVKNYLPAGGIWTAFEISNKGYIVGGSDWGPIYNYTRQYNAATDSWVAKQNFPWYVDGNGTQYGLYASSSYGVCNYGFLFYAYEVWNGSSYTTYNQTWRFNATSSTSGDWSQLAPFPGTPRMDPEFVMVDGRGYLFGGYNNVSGSTTLYTDLWLFNPTTGSTVSPRMDDAPDVTYNSNATSSDAITLAPNPADNATEISYKSAFETAQLKVYNSNAVAVYQEALTSKEGKIQLNTENFENGVYFCIIQSGDKVIGKQRLVIAK